MNLRPLIDNHLFPPLFALWIAYTLYYDPTYLNLIISLCIYWLIPYIYSNNTNSATLPMRALETYTAMIVSSIISFGLSNFFRLNFFSSVLLSLFCFMLIIGSSMVGYITLYAGFLLNPFMLASIMKNKSKN